MWLKVDDGIARHPKVLAAAATLNRGRRRGGRSRVLGAFTELGTYAAEHLTNGFVPIEIALRLDDVDAKATLDAMTAAGLLHQVDGGYELHDFSDWNPGADEVKAKRQRDRERKRRDRRSKLNLEAQP